MKRILAADDDPMIRRVLELTLQKVGEVSTASNGAEAVALLESGKGFDCVVLDFDMPKMSGSDVVNWMKSGGGHGEVPIVMLTAYDSPDIERELLAKGVTGYLTKPLDPSALIALVSRLVGAG